MSLPKSSNQILKDIYFHLSTRTSIRQLRQWGWFDFQNHDYPDSSDPIVLAVAAFQHLSIADSGNWNGTTDVLTALLAYLKAETGYSYSAAQLKDLAALLNEQPVRSKAVENWFDQTFR